MNTDKPSDDVTILVGAEALITGDLKEINIGPGKRGWMEGWKTIDTSLTWTVQIPQADVFEICVLAFSPKGSRIELSVNGQTLTAKLDTYANRTTLGLAKLPAGDVILRIRSASDEPDIVFYSLEVIRPDVKKAMQERAISLRADTQWLIEAKYGLMFHWTSQTVPATGEPKSYAKAVEDFDVPRFVDMVEQCGAGAIIFTTSHGEWYFPGPILLIDKMIPGRTTSRDLIMELADALNARGIKLILYQNPGHDDPEWWRLTGYEKGDKTAYFDQWCKVVEAIGKHYGEKVAGWWFDDSFFCHYPYQAPWEQMLKSSRAGHPGRLVGVNSFTFPKATDFQDYFCGEIFVNEVAEVGERFLPEGGTGRFVGGPQNGLQAVITALFEMHSGWVHVAKDTPIAMPVMNAQELVNLINHCAARKNVPFFNLEIYQDATISPASFEVFQQAARALKRH